MLALLFSACEPMEDIHKDVDKEIEDALIKSEYFARFEPAVDAYELTDEDYKLSSNENVQNYKNFSDVILPKDFLPEILNQKFAGENGTEMMVTYNYYSKVIVDKDGAQEISPDEYTIMGQKYSNFSDEDVAKYAIGKLLDEQSTYYKVKTGTEKTTMYALFKQKQNRYIKVNADFTTEVLNYVGDNSYELKDADYESVGNGKYKNFSNIQEAQEKVAQFAQESGKGAGNYTCFVYTNYFDTYLVYRYNGTNWEIAQSVVPVSGLVTYKVMDPNYQESTWKVVLPIQFVKTEKEPQTEYTLTDEDYELVGNGRYMNFDVREGKAEESEAVRIEKVSKILKSKFEVVDGDVYKVYFEVYSGSAETWNLTIEAVEGE